MVEHLLVDAICAINEDVESEDQARLAVSALRKTMSHPDKLAANRDSLELLRDGARVILAPGEDAKTVRFIEFDPQRLKRLQVDRDEDAAAAVLLGLLAVKDDLAILAIDLSD